MSSQTASKSASKPVALVLALVAVLVRLPVLVLEVKHSSLAVGPINRRSILGVVVCEVACYFLITHSVLTSAKHYLRANSALQVDRI